MQCTGAKDKKRTNRHGSMRETRDSDESNFRRVVGTYRVAINQKRRNGAFELATLISYDGDQIKGYLLSRIVATRAYL